jgi:antitoxin MazE
MIVKRATLSKWGNSLAIRIPDSFIEFMQTSSGDTVELAFSNGGFRVDPAPTKKMTMQERLASIRPDNLNIDREWLNAAPVGKEVWSYEK